MGTANVIDGVCRYFGGPYDEPTRTYRGSPVPGVGVVRRAWAKRDEHADYFYGQPPGARTGCQIVVQIPRRSETRIALGGEHSGRKQVVYEISLHCYLRHRVSRAEDAQDDVFDLEDNLINWMRADRTLGGAVFQAGEHIDGGHGGDGIVVTYGQPESKAELTKSYLGLTFAAVEITAA